MMKVKLCTLAILLSLLNSNCRLQCDLSQISEKIYVTQKLEFEDNIHLRTLNEYRKKIKWYDHLKYSCDHDTIFILEFPGVQGDFRFTFWSKKDTISYTNETGIFEMTKAPLFTNHMMQLVSQWDILQIKEEEKINSNFISNEIIYATKIILSNRKHTIRSIYFKDFFNPKRDIYNQFDDLNN